MHRKHLRALDLNLLPVLQALLRHRNVTRAAAAVGLSQPAASRALGRLRALFEDPLLVRAPGGLALTARAQAIERQINPALAAVRGIFRAESFVPADIEHTVRIAATDAVAVLVGPALSARLRREAPRVRVQFQNYGNDAERRLQAGELDFAFALASTPLPPGTRSALVAQDRLALVMRRGHRASRGRITLEQYAGLTHAAISISGDGRSEIDAELATHGLEREIGFTAPQFTAALAVVAGTDLVTTVSRSFAARLAPALGLVLREPPLATPALAYVLVWARIRDHDPVVNWLRSVIGTICRTQIGASGRRIMCPRS